MRSLQASGTDTFKVSSPMVQPWRKQPDPKPLPEPEPKPLM